MKLLPLSYTDYKVAVYWLAEIAYSISRPHISPLAGKEPLPTPTIHPPTWLTYCPPHIFRLGDASAWLFVVSCLKVSNSRYVWPLIKRNKVLANRLAGRRLALL